jgi:hypothetical protein
LKFGVVAAVAQATHVVTVVHSQLEDLVATTQLKQSILIQAVNIAYAQVAVGHVVNHIHVQQVWDVVHM